MVTKKAKELRARQHSQLEEDGISLKGYRRAGRITVERSIEIAEDEKLNIRHRAQTQAEKGQQFSLMPAAVDELGGADASFETERELVEHALAFANFDTDVSQYIKRINKVFARLGKDPGADPAQLSAEARQEVRRFFELSLRSRKELRGTEPHGEIVGTIPWESFLQGVWVIPVVIGDESTESVRLLNHTVFEDGVTLLNYVQVLFADDSRPYARDLCECKLASCKRLFLAKKPAVGRPQRVYCKRDHMLEAHAMQSTTRAQKSRKARKPK